jgi:glutamyl/glutaminyl-tRNA synthetase
MRYKTRIAPTPSGYLHLGNCYSFVITALIAHRYDAPILLRIDDMDRARYRGAYVLDVLETLNFLELSYSEGPTSIADFEANWSQLNRLVEYRRVLDKLCEQNLLYACTCSRKQLTELYQREVWRCNCSRKQLPLDAENVNWRLKTDKRLLKMFRAVDRSDSYTLPDVMTDFVVRKRDEMPAYQLCSLVDDLYFRCNLFVRGADLFDSSLAQLFLADVLGAESFKQSIFIHHDLIKQQGQKLSKTQGASPVAKFQNQKGGQLKLWRLIGEKLNAPKTVDNLNVLKEIDWLPASVVLRS